MNHDYYQAREVTDLYDQLADAADKVATLEARILTLQAEILALRSIAERYREYLDRAWSLWV